MASACKFVGQVCSAVAVHLFDFNKGICRVTNFAYALAGH